MDYAGIPRCGRTRGTHQIREVHPPGAWGRIMHGGAWLRGGDTGVDVILRDVDVALQWTQQAETGIYELDALVGYLAGLPSYSLAAELSLGRVLAGELPVVGAVPPALVASAPPRWRFSRDFSLDYARMHARRGNLVGTAGQWRRQQWKKPTLGSASVGSGRSTRSG